MYGRLQRIVKGLNGPNSPDAPKVAWSALELGFRA